MLDNNSDLFEHYEFIASTGQLPLRVDKFIMNFIENASRTKVQKAIESSNVLVNGYFDLKRRVRYNFVNLVSLREIVCFRLKISMHTFEETLNEIYRLNISGQLNIHISLEVDKLPEETSVMYMKREPVMVDGSYRNIIAIDVAKGGLE